MSNQSLAVQAFCFQGIKDIDSILEELRHSDPDAHRAAVDGLQNVDWNAVRRQIAKESLREFATEKKLEFVEGDTARNLVDAQGIYTLSPTTELVGVVKKGMGAGIEIAMTMSRDGTCECFSNFMIDAHTGYSNPRQQRKAPAIHEKKPPAQTRLEEIYREHMSKAVFKMLLGNDADQIKKLDDQTVIMRFTIKKEG